MKTLRRWLLGARTPCATWPCRRCDKAGRTFWRAREQWHDAHRRALFGYVERPVLTLLLTVTLFLSRMPVLR